MTKPPDRGAPQARAVEAPDAGAVRRAAVALWVALAVLAVARAVLAFVPSMALWALNLQRFLSPAIAWAPWAALLATLIPAAGRRIAPPLEALGGWLARSRLGGSALALALGAAIPALLPDRVRFVGDFLLRQGTVEEGEAPAVLFPQALPLDVFLHYRLPLALHEAGLASANVAARWIGAVEAGLLAVLALAFARALALRGAALVAAAATVYFCGALALFTGYSKAFGELALLAVAAAVAGVTVARAGGSAGEPRAGSAADPAEGRAERALLGLGLGLAIGVLLHRSAFGLLPAAVAVWVMWLRARGAVGLRRPLAIVALLLPAIVMAVMVPRILADVRRWDVVHFAPAEVRSGGGPLRAAFAGTRPLDLLNLALLLSPLSVPALAAAIAGPSLLRRREPAILALLAAPFVLVAPFIHPVQGLYRDWDDFTLAAVTLSLLAAFAVSALLDGAIAAPARGAAARSARVPAAAGAWLAAAAILGAAVPTLQWLAHQSDEPRGMARVEAFVHEPPGRGPVERAKTWDYIGIVRYRRERWGESADAFARAAETGPSPRILQSWAMAETNRGDLAHAQAIYHRLLAISPETTLGWLGLAAVSSRLAVAAPTDSARAAQIAESRHAANELLRLQPGSAEAREILQALDQIERSR